MHRLAFVHSGIPADKLTESDGPFWVQKVYRRLRELGDVEGQNLVVERFSANGRSERFASLATEVVGRKPDVIVVNFNDLAKKFTIATSTIPVSVSTQASRFTASACRSSRKRNRRVEKWLLFSRVR
jgi:putative ABC transport system substrate-binding protein